MDMIKKDILFDLLNDNTSNGVLISDIEGKLLYGNKKFSEVSGIAITEDKSVLYYDFCKEINTVEKWESFLRDLQKHKKLIFKNRMLHAQSKESVLCEITHKLSYIDNNPVILSFFTDYTEKHALKNDLYLYKQKFSSLSDNMIQGMLSITPDGIIEYCNSKFEELSGYPKEQLIGRNIDFLSSNNADGILSLFKKIDEQSEFELEYRRNDGKKRWWYTHVSSNYDESGYHHGYTTILFDITEQRMLHDELESALKKAYELTTFKSGLISAISFKLRNPLNGIFGMIRELKQGTLTQEQKRNVNNAFLASRHMLGTLNEIISFTEELDINLQKTQQAAKAKEEFLANMSHEIRTPLNGIIGMIRELKTTELSNDQRNYLDNAVNASEHLLSIINNILDIAKIGSGEFQLNEHDFSIRDVHDSVSSIFSQQANAKNIYFNIDLDENIPNQIKGDPARMRQIIVNLVGNAIKFTEEGGVTLETHLAQVDLSQTKKEEQNNQIKYTRVNNPEEANRIILKVSDTGIGMSQEFMKNLFTKFQQEDSTNSRKHEGTGLGLSISRELVYAMDGDISVSSEKGKGSHFVVCLPLNVAENMGIHETEKPLDTQSLLGKRVLLVEDNALNRQVAKFTLSKLGLIVDEAINGQIAFEKAQQNEYDIILMDIQMPVLDGLESTKKIRKELGLTLPIIALTAHAFKSEITRFIETGMNDYVTKPFEENVLINCLIKYTSNC